MRKTYLYRLYPTKKQLKALETTLEECRWLYNNTLAYRKEAWEERQERVSYYDSKARIPILKAERPSLKNVHSQVLQNVTERVELAFQAFFRRIKAGEQDPGYPRFKGSGRYDSFTLQMPRGRHFLPNSLAKRQKLAERSSKLIRPIRVRHAAGVDTARRCPWMSVYSLVPVVLFNLTETSMLP